jgi:tetratricopeptide (TPR) repeat protein
MAHFPDTFRQIFEGRNEWSDFMPWYYLIKSMAITIPFIVLAGVILFILFSRSIFKGGKGWQYGMLVFTILFPIVFVLYEKSNLYSSWRQFLFLYPGIILISAIGFNSLFVNLSKKYFTGLAILSFAILAIHPLKFMIINHPYYYLYYNQFVGGLKGAYSNYETDYYYVTQTEASEWLRDYLKENSIESPVKVKATFSVSWMFRNQPDVQTSYFRFEERSMSDWDYGIVVNRYIPVFQLKNGMWPPKNAIHIIYADGVPMCAVLKRESKDDYLGYVALNEGRNEDAVKHFTKVLESGVQDEMIFYNFAAALYNSGSFNKADSILKKGLEINPDFEPILMYLGNIARFQKREDEAIFYYERVIKANRKYFEAYLGLSELLSEKDVKRARRLLRECLTIDPRYKPAIYALADTYRDSDPEIAKKYKELADSFE